MTLRKLLEAIRDRNDEFTNPTRNSDDYRQAVEALAILDQADEVDDAESGEAEWRVIRDPEGPRS